MIPQELIQQWEKEAEEKYSHDSLWRHDYVETQKLNYYKSENERLKGLLEESYRGMMTEFFDGRDNDKDISILVEENWQQYKQHHNL